MTYTNFSPPLGGWGASSPPFRRLGGLHFLPLGGNSHRYSGWGVLANPVLGMFLFCVGLIAVFICLMPPVTSTAFSPPLPKFRQTFSIPSPINCFILYLNATRLCVAFFLHYYLHYYLHISKICCTFAPNLESPGPT